MDHDTGRSDALPRRSAMIGLARALVETLGAEEAVPVLLGEFGWDPTFQTLARLTGVEADTAFARVWEQLLTQTLAADLDHWPP